jgi:hypothetical protein
MLAAVRYLFISGISSTVADAAAVQSKRLYSTAVVDQMLQYVNKDLQVCTGC